MTALEFFLIQHARQHSADVGPGAGFADRVYGGLEDAQMRVRPEAMNSLAWLLWHTARTEDVAVNLVIAAGRQVFDDAWATRLRVERRDIGTGMRDDEVTDLTARVDLAALRAYRSAVGWRTREVAAALPAAGWQEVIGPADLDRAVAAGAFAVPWVRGVWQGSSRGERLGATAIAHNAMHLGEAVTIRAQAGFPMGM